VYRFVEREKASHPVTTMCRMLGVSPSGYFSWRRRPPSDRGLADEALTVEIRRAHALSRGTYGAPRIRAELAAAGTRVGRRRVARLMTVAGLAGVTRRRHVVTTRRDPAAAPAPDLVRRHFSAPAPDRLWVADISYLPTGEGFLYLAAIVDAFSRRVVGWSMASHLRTSLVLDALDAAIGARHPVPGLVHHSDRGTQYTSLAVGARLLEAGIAISMGAPGTAYDNAMAESFFASLETELIDRTAWGTHDQARADVFEYIEIFYNRTRRHSSIDYLSPVEFERRYRSRQAAA
jgi:putative transposase